MRTIIQQIMQPVVEKILKRILKRIQKNKTLDEWVTETLEGCKEMAIKIAQTCCDEMNKEIRKNKFRENRRYIYLMKSTTKNR